MSDVAPLTMWSPLAWIASFERGKRVIFAVDYSSTKQQDVAWKVVKARWNGQEKVKEDKRKLALSCWRRKALTMRLLCLSNKARRMRA